MGSLFNIPQREVLLVGGACDGHRVTVYEGETERYVPIPVDPALRHEGSDLSAGPAILLRYRAIPGDPARFEYAPDDARRGP